MRAGWWLEREGRSLLRPHGEPPSWRRANGQAASSWRAARKECHWKLAGRPKGVPFSSGRAGTAGTTETAGKWQAMLPRQAIGLGEGNAAAPSHWLGRSPQAFFKREAPSRRNPGGLGGPGGPGSRRQSAKRPAPAQPPARRQLFLVSAPQRKSGGNEGNRK